MRVLDRGKDILFAARSSKKEAAAQAIFLHAIGDGIIPGSAVVANTGLLKKTSIAKEPAAGRRRVVIIGAEFAGIAAAYSW